MSDETPPSVADSLGNAGPLPEIAWGGKVYPVGLPCPLVIAHAERMCVRLATESLKDTEEFTDPKEYAERKAALETDISGRQYAFGHRLFNAAINGPDGNTLILWACLRLKTPGIRFEDVRKMRRDDSAAADVEAAMFVISPLFFQCGADTAPGPESERKALGARMAADVLANMLEAKARKVAVVLADSPTT